MTATPATATYTSTLSVVVASARHRSTRRYPQTTRPEVQLPPPTLALLRDPLPPPPGLVLAESDPSAVAGDQRATDARADVVRDVVPDRRARGPDGGHGEEGEQAPA